MCMRSRLWLVVFSFLLGLTAPVVAQGLGSQATSGLKLGFVNSLGVLQGTDEGKQKLAQLEQWTEGRRKKLEQAKTELDKLKEQFAAQERTLNPDTKTEMVRTMEDRDRRLRREQEDSQIEAEAMNRKMLDQIGANIQKIIAEYAQENGFSVVFLRNETQAYVDPALDITSDLISIYNQRHPVGSAQATKVLGQ